jgi:hypothetical protein
MSVVEVTTTPLLIRLNLGVKWTKIFSEKVNRQIKV